MYLQAKNNKLKLFARGDILELVICTSDKWLTSMPNWKNFTHLLSVLFAIALTPENKPTTTSARFLQLLKQNSVTAALDKDQAQELKSRMAKKLDFSALQGKVVPLRETELQTTPSAAVMPAD